MSVAARVLSVLVLVSFLGLLLVRAALPAYREPFKDALILERAAHKKIVNELDAEIRKNSSLIENLTREIEVIKGELIDLDHAIDVLRQKELDLMKEIEARKREIERIKVDLAQFRTIYDQELKANERLIAANDQLRQELAEVRYLKVQAETLAIKRSEEKARLEREIRVLSQGLRDVERELRGKQLVVAWVEQQGVNVSRVLDHAYVEPVDAKVVQSDPALGLYLLNRGKNAGVKAGYEFLVMRDGHYVGKIIVDTVYPDYSAAHEVLTEAGDLMRAEVRVGDAASTAPWFGREN